MMKLTNIHAAFAPPHRNAAQAPRVGKGPVSPGVSLHAISNRHVLDTRKPHRRGLSCSWAKDAAGHLICAWSEPSIDDQPIRWRGFCRASVAMAA
jgi:hypothetical protein